MNSANESRNEKMLRLYESGKYSLRELGKKFHLHHSTVAVCIAKIRRKRKNKK